MSLLVETIKVKDGRLYNIDYHSERFNFTRRVLFGIRLKVELTRKLVIPAYAQKGIFKCRIEYDEHIRSINFLPYEIRDVNTLRLVEAGDTVYPYKYIERAGLNKLFDTRGGCDDVLIVKDGHITDTSYSNIIVKDSEGNWFTPTTYLLPGTKRKYLIDTNKVTEVEITPASLRKYTELRLINSMIDINDTAGIPVKSICF